MTKSELIELIAEHQPQLSHKDIELAVKTMIEHMSQVLATGDRIEIRGFGSFRCTIGSLAWGGIQKPVIQLSCLVNMFLISNLVKNYVSG